MLEALVAPQGVDDVVDLGLELAVRQVELLDGRLFVLDDQALFLCALFLVQTRKMFTILELTPML